MKVTKEELSATKRKVAVEIPPAQVQEVVESLYRNLRKTAKVKGFRPGKVPRNVLQQYYHEYVTEKAVNQLIGDTYPKALSEGSIEPVSPPVIDTEGLLEGQAFTYTAVVETLPPLEVNNYKGLKIRGVAAEVVAEDVDREMLRLQQMYSQLTPVEDRDEVVEGDVVVLDFQAFSDGRPVRDATTENHTLEVGSGTMIPGFEEALIGKKRGIGHEFTITIPDDHSRKDLAGKEVAFKVTIKDIRRKVLPELDDEFAKDVGSYKDLGELKSAIEQDIKKAKERFVREGMRQQVIDKLIEMNPLEVPSYLVERRAEELLEEVKFRLKSERREFSQEAEQALRPQYTPAAERDVKASLLIEQIARQEDISVSDEDVAAHVEELARAHGRSADTLKNDIGVMSRVRRTLQRDNVMDFLINHAEIEWVEAPADEGGKQ